MALLQELDLIAGQLQQLSFNKSWQWVNALKEERNHISDHGQIKVLDEIISDCSFIMINPKLLTAKINKLKVSLGGVATPWQDPQSVQKSKESNKKTLKEWLEEGKISDEKYEFLSEWLDQNNIFSLAEINAKYWELKEKE